MQDIKAGMRRPLICFDVHSMLRSATESSLRMQTGMSGSCICIEVHCLLSSAAGPAAQAAAGAFRLHS